MEPTETNDVPHSPACKKNTDISQCSATAIQTPPRWNNSLDINQLPSWVPLFFSHRYVVKAIDDSVASQATTIENLTGGFLVAHETTKSMSSAVESDQRTQTALNCFISSPFLLSLLYHLIDHCIDTEDDHPFLEALTRDWYRTCWRTYKGADTETSDDVRYQKTFSQPPTSAEQPTGSSATATAFSGTDHSSARPKEHRRVFSGTRRPSRTPMRCDSAGAPVESMTFPAYSPAASEGVGTSVPPRPSRPPSPSLPCVPSQVQMQFSLLYASVLPFIVWSYASYTVKQQMDTFPPSTTVACPTVADFLIGLSELIPPPTTMLHVPLAVDERHIFFAPVDDEGGDLLPGHHGSRLRADHDPTPAPVVKPPVPEDHGRSASREAPQQGQRSTSLAATTTLPTRAQRARTPYTVKRSGLFETVNAALQNDGHETSEASKKIEETNPYCKAMRRTVLFSAPASEPGCACHYARDHAVRFSAHRGKLKRRLFPWLVLQCLRRMRVNSFPFFCPVAEPGPLCMAAVFGLAATCGFLRALAAADFVDVQAFLAQAGPSGAVLDRRTSVRTGYRFPVDEDLMLELGIQAGHLRLHTCDVSFPPTTPEYLKSCITYNFLEHTLRMCRFRSELEVLPRSVAFFMSLESLLTDMYKP